MNTFANYITKDEDAPSYSNLYFTDLSGCVPSLLTDLMKENHADEDACFEYLYRKAQKNLQIDLHRKLAERFHIDKKLVTRETSQFEDSYNSASGLAGVTIELPMPKYGRLEIVSIEANSESAHVSPAGQIVIRRDSPTGEVLSTLDAEIVAGKVVIPVFETFEESKIFVGYDPESLTLKSTKNLYYPKDNSISGSTTDLSCTFPCLDGEGAVRQINGGGVNVKFVVYCSIEKFILDNLPIFQFALHYRLGVETMKERITTPNVNVSSVLTEDRAKELLAVHNEDYVAAMDAAVSNIKMTEDPICFLCKRSVSTKVSLP